MPTYYNMGLSWPTPSVTIGPAWATMATVAIGIIDEHDHTSGRGVQIPTSGLSLDADLTFNGYNAEELRSVRFDNHDDEPALAADVNTIFAWDNNLYWRTVTGTSVQITNGGVLSSVPTSNNYTQQAISANTLITAATSWQHALVDTTTPITLTLGAAVGFGVGQYFIISDVTGNAASSPITVTAYGGTDTINGSTASATVFGPYAQHMLVRISSTGWLLIPWAVPTYLNKATVPEAGALTTGHVLKVSGASALTYGPLDLADADAVTGVLPIANLPDATWVVKGIQRISADAYGAAGSALYHWRLSGTGTTAWVGGANTQFVFEDDAAGGTKYFGYEPTKVADYATRHLVIQGDPALGPTSRTGGALGVFAGNGYGTGAGGAITLVAGESGGAAGGDGGDITLTAGDGIAGDGGDVTIVAGSGIAGGVATYGRIKLSTDGSTPTSIASECSSLALTRPTTRTPTRAAISLFGTRLRHTLARLPRQTRSSQAS
jgi:hypothetical protein